MNTQYKTDDLNLTSFLLVQGIKLASIYQDSPKHFIFVLTNPSECLQLKQNYLNNAHAPAQELFSKREMLINEIKNVVSSDSRKGLNHY